MTSDQIQLVVDAENKRLNEISLAKATAELREVAAINKEIERLQESRAKAQARVAALKFDSVSAADIIGDQSAAAGE